MDDLKNNLKQLAENKLQTEQEGGLHQHSDAFRLIFEYSIHKNFRVEGYNLKKLVQDPHVHWNEIKDMLFDINETPGLADKGFRELLDFWMNDLKSQHQQ